MTVFATLGLNAAVTLSEGMYTTKGSAPVTGWVRRPRNPRVSGHYLRSPADGNSTGCPRALNSLLHVHGVFLWSCTST